MKKRLIIALIAVFAISGFAQTKATGPADSPEKVLNELALATLRAHGGDKLKKMTSLTITGTGEVTTSAIQQAIPITFVNIFAGQKYRFELINPFQPIKQTFDGTQTYSNVDNGFALPPLNLIGFPVLQRIGDAGFVVSALPAPDKNGFRLTSPEGYYTDFYLDKKSGKLKGYDSSYVMNGRTVSTSVEIDKLRDVDGISVPEKYAQRFDLGQMTVYAAFKAKEIVVNREIADEIFVLTTAQPVASEIRQPL